MLAHNGYDFSSSDKTIYAPHDGFVTLRRHKTGYGLHIEIESQSYEDVKCRYSVLAHLSEFLVKDKAFVHAGDPVGIMGTTGTSTGVHLHWTYKVKAFGETLDIDNGYFGALDVIPHTVVWYPVSTPALPASSSESVFRVVSRLIGRFTSRASQNAKE
jgi:murein DD-endopeptidase MepM/ murein hydrolase activator NlpD